MSHEHHSKHHSKKLHKLAQLLKNRHTRDINQQAEAHARGRDLDQEREEEIKEAGLASSRSAEKTGKDGSPVWSAKMQEIRDRNTGRKRMAMERWNRFAGTESGEGRGL